MARETIADLKVQIGILEEQLRTTTRDNARLEKDRDAWSKKVSTLRGEIVEVKAERDRLVGYCRRVQESEQPEERREHDRRQHPRDHHQSLGHDFGLYGNNKEPDEPWYA